MRDHIKKTQAILCCAFILGILLLGVLYQVKQSKYKYVTGIYAKYCYTKENPHPNIKTKLKYETLEECNKPLR